MNEIIVGTFLGILAIWGIIYLTSIMLRRFFPQRKRIYIICPVRNLSEEEEQKILAYARNLEENGYKVRVPFRDTNQDDKIGLRICDEHEKDILWADQIHIWWNRDSEGSLYDFACARMAKRFGPKKKIILINLEEIQVTLDKSYTNVVLATHFGLDPTATLKDLLMKIKESA